MMNSLPILLRFRDQYKRLSQSSFSLTQLEKQYPMDGMTEEEKKVLIKEYTRRIYELQEILEELRKIEKEAK